VEIRSTGRLRLVTHATVRGDRDVYHPPRHHWTKARKTYKDLDSVIAQQTDLVEVVAHLKQVVCVKG
jgi:RNA-splicing ligase RtcB